MKELLRQGARFGAVGIFATILHLAAAWAANRWFGLGEYAANGVGFAVSFSFSYLGHFYWTFAQQSEHQRSLARFLVVAGIGYAITNLIVWVVTDALDQPFELALLGILLVVPPTTWMISRIWAFAPR
ncbi:MAG: GtrA family protein [Pseudomonadota bacterium]